jgi:uncharacterized membrane protein YfcA
VHGSIGIGTTLLIIAFNSLFGFIGDLTNYPMDWPLLIIFSALSITAIFIGTALSAIISGYKLKKSFGWFILAMGIYIIARELFL